MASSQNGGRNQVSGRVSAPCWHATPVANAPWKPLNSVKVNFGRSLNRCRVGETGLNNQSTCKPPKRGRNQVSGVVKRLRRRHYDPMIIERTIGLVLGPSTALYEPFLKHCTLTNKAVGTIWRALSKPPQRRQGPDLCPLWLLVGTPSTIRPELAFSRAEHSRPYSDVAKYIFLIYDIY